MGNNRLYKYNIYSILRILLKLRFKLPRNNYYFCSRNSIGDLTEAGLPNITYTQSNQGFPLSITTTGALQTAYASTKSLDAFSGGDGTYLPDFDASRCSSIYGNSNTVQPLSVNCYLEFYLN